MAQRTNKKPANTKTKRTQAAKKNTQTKTRAAARKPRDQEVHKQRNQIVAILLFAFSVFLGCLVCIQGESAWAWMTSCIFRLIWRYIIGMADFALLYIYRNCFWKNTVTDSISYCYDSNIDYCAVRYSLYLYGNGRTAKTSVYHEYDKII